MKWLYIVLLGSSCLWAKEYTQWKPIITAEEMLIEPQNWETCYQYAQRKVRDMIKKYSERRIEGSIWLSKYWEYHYYGALNWRNYFWKQT